MTARPAGTGRKRRPARGSGELTRGDVKGLMTRSYIRPLEPVPPLHVMARRAQTNAVDAWRRVADGAEQATRTVANFIDQNEARGKDE